MAISWVLHNSLCLTHMGSPTSSSFPSISYLLYEPSWGRCCRRLQELEAGLVEEESRKRLDRIIEERVKNILSSDAVQKSLVQRLEQERRKIEEQVGLLRISHLSVSRYGWSYHTPQHHEVFSHSLVATGLYMAQCKKITAWFSHITLQGHKWTWNEWNMTQPRGWR